MAVYVYMHIYRIYTWIWLYLCICICTVYIYIHTHTYICTYECVIYVCVCVCTQHTHVFLYPEVWGQGQNGDGTGYLMSWSEVYGIWPLWPLCFMAALTRRPDPPSWPRSLRRTTSLWTSCAVSCRQTRLSTASREWPPTPAPTPCQVLWTTCPSPRRCMARVTSNPLPPAHALAPVRHARPALRLSCPPSPARVWFALRLQRGELDPSGIEPPRPRSDSLQNYFLQKRKKVTLEKVKNHIFYYRKSIFFSTRLKWKRGKINYLHRNVLFCCDIGK